MSVASRRLADAHRQAQNRLGAQAVLQMRAIWPLLDVDDLDGSFRRWLTAAVPLIQGQRSTSARLAANFLAASKTLAMGSGATFAPVLSETASVPAVTTSLLVTGPVSIKRAVLRSVPLARATATAEAASAAAAMRHVLNGGRETVIRTLADDSDARGWQRVASGNACKFCDLLDGKFHHADTADFEAHDGCSCSQEPVYGARRVSERSLAARQ